MFLSSFKNPLLKKAAFAGFVLLFLTTVLTGCDSNGGGGPPLRDRLVGVWETQFDEFIITRDTLTWSDGESTFLAGYIQRVIGLRGEEASGVIIIQYSEPPSSYNYPDGFAAIYIRGDTGSNSLQISTAFTVTDWQIPVDVETLQEAIDIFTGPGFFNSFIGSWEFVPNYVRE